MSETRIIKKVLTTVPYKGWHWDKLADALKGAEIVRADHNDEAAVIKAIADVDVAIMGGDISLERIKAAKNLKWVHCDHAGVNNSAHPELFERGIFLTASAGRSAPVLAEHAFYLALSLIYDSRTVDAQQRAHVWNNLYIERRGLYTKTLGVVGLGHTGKAVAKLGNAMGMRVIGYDRNEADLPDGVEKAWFTDRGEGIDGLLKESDVIILSVRLSDETFHLIDERAFGIMKNTALLINMARGAVVDEKALYTALVNNRIAGAASDVFETEPLQASSPLWDLPNMVITPHCTPEVPDLTASCLNIISDNIQRYKEGRPLRNLMDSRDVYTKAAK
jgi:phosphoglycerate dehydrogenase-like enzyme